MFRIKDAQENQDKLQHRQSQMTPDNLKTQDKHRHLQTTNNQQQNRPNYIKTVKPMQGQLLSDFLPFTY